MVTKSNPREPSVKLERELRRGVLVLATLAQLGTAQYGYELRQHLAQKGLAIEEGTLYPLLRRLEAQGLLDSDWRTGEGPPRRYYVLSPAGQHTLATLTASWQRLRQTMDLLLDDGGR